MPRSSGSRFCGACLATVNDRWLAKHHFASAIPDEHAFAQAMDSAILPIDAWIEKMDVDGDASVFRLWT
jgi:hypothetical protein